MFPGVAPSPVDATEGYAFAFGMVGVANPCGIPLLPAYLAFFTDGTGGRLGGAVRSVWVSGCVTAGFVACFGVLGLLLEGILAGVESAVPWLMVLLGAALVALGAASLSGRNLRLPQVALRPSRMGRRPAAMAAFGVVYGLASLGCSLPVFLAAVGGGLGAAGAGTVLTSSLAYALGMGVVLAGLALGASALRPAALRVLRPLGRAGSRLGALLVMLSGAYLAYFWVMSLAYPGTTPPVVAAVNRAQSALAGFVQADARWLGAALAAAVVGVLLAAALAGGRTPASQPARSGDG